MGKEVPAVPLRWEKGTFWYFAPDIGVVSA